MSNVKLAIRVRPFTEKELKTEKYPVSVVSVVDHNTITITNIKVSASGAGDSRERVRRYHADFTFDSACPITHPAYASQEKVFETVGRQVISTISSGQSACVLTYGQSATGKTHTMMGSAMQPGLIPRICKALADETPLDITVSFLEIYNERVHDLLDGDTPLTLNSLPRRNGNVRKDLRVREHPTKGPYVQNLRRVTVHDLESLLAVVKEGTRRRRTAATKRNSSSSRSHALLELVTPLATLHLADLAGSEKAGCEGCAGGRQKEGANINKSLVALSNVVAALVSGNSGQGRFVPYRDSALTWLLKDCFTGGGSTFIIATLSPSVSCYGESASTLRWAARARRLPYPRTTSTTNVVSKAAVQAQLNHLIAELASHYIHYKPETRQIFFDVKHWDLHKHIKKNNNITGTKAKIGNVMNLRYQKPDTRNSESTSSIASGSSDIVHNSEKQAEISNEINKEIDKLFGPALERTRSGSDIEVVAPLRHKKHYFRSQEQLSSEKLQSNKDHRLAHTETNELIGNDSSSANNPKILPVSILYDNQRAEIIASVTERLYSKLKKNEAPISEIETVIDKKPLSEPKIMQPLNELKICSNARQRLMELSKKALRNKRKIGIPAHTQTRKTVIRMKDQSIDIQTDLRAYIRHQKSICTFQQDVSTETTPITPRSKEIGCGPTYSTMIYKDSSTITESKKVTLKNSSTMTELILTSNDFTQTKVQPPRRKKRVSAYSKYIKKIESLKSSTDENNVSSVININISPMYAAETESQNSDDTLDNPLKTEKEKERHSPVTTPDLLTNHDNVLKQAAIKSISDTSSDENYDLYNFENIKQLRPQVNVVEDFSDTDEVPLPRITVEPNRKLGRKDYEDLVLGRNENLYPYNIKLSPTYERDETRKVIRFNDVDVTPEECGSKEWQKKINLTHNFDHGDSDYSVSSDLSKIDSCSSLWNKSSWVSYDNTLNYQRKKSKSEASKHPYYSDVEDIDTRNKIFTCLDSQCGEDFCLNRKQNKHKTDDNKKKQSSKNKTGYKFHNIESKIKSACNSLEASVNKYDNYLIDFRGKTKQYYKTEMQTRTPTEYLQHLIKLRREAVKSDCHEK